MKKKKQLILGSQDFQSVTNWMGGGAFAFVGFELFFFFSPSPVPRILFSIFPGSGMEVGVPGGLLGGMWLVGCAQIPMDGWGSFLGRFHGWLPSMLTGGSRAHQLHQAPKPTTKLTRHQGPLLQRPNMHHPGRLRGT